MNQKSNGLIVDPAAILERLPTLGAALAEGKLAAEILLQQAPEGLKAECRQRLEVIEQGLVTVNELAVYMQHISDK